MKQLLLTLTTLALIGLSNIANAQAPNWVWAKNAGSNGIGRAISVTSDAVGNLIVVGAFSSPTITFGITTLTNLSPSSYGDMFIVKYDPFGNVLWAKSALGSGSIANSVTVDAAGNIIISGNFVCTTITFDSITLTKAGGGPYISDLFIVKYDPNGIVLWAKSAGGNAIELAKSVTTNTSGNIIVVGYFQSSTITFDNTTLTNNSDPGYSDLFIVKYDPSGNVVWAKSEGDVFDDKASSVTEDVAGNIIVTGDFNSPTIIFGNTILSVAHPNNLDVFVAKYDQAGTVVWAKSGGGDANDWATSISNDANGNTIIVGFFRSGNLKFDSLNLFNGTPNSNTNDIFIVKYDSAGTVIWARSVGGSDYDFANSVTTDVLGNIIVVGNYFSPTISFGSDTLTNANSVSDDKMLIIKYDPVGTSLWAKSADNSSSSESGNGITSDATGKLIVAGVFNSPTITFGSNTLTMAVGSSNIFLAKLDNTTGLENQSNSNVISIYPNPATNELTISIGQLANGKAVTISITDVTGKLIYKNTSASIQKTTVNTTNFAAGVYAVQVQTADSIETKKVIVAR